MQYANPELLSQLAAEYALGTLRGRARRRFERLLRQHPGAREQVEFWEQRLSEFGQNLPPVAPPAEARGELLRRIAPAVARPPEVAPTTLLPAATALPARDTRRRPGLRRRRHRWAWPYAAGFASAAALVLAFLAGQHNAGPVSSPAAAVAQAEGLPIYSARLQMPASSMQWLVSLSPDHRQVSVLAADDYLQLGRFRPQLWAVPQGGEPVPLGRLPSERDGSVAFDIPERLRGHPEVQFVVSLEPATGGNNRPAATVLSAATALGGI